MSAALMDWSCVTATQPLPSLNSSAPWAGIALIVTLDRASPSASAYGPKSASVSTRTWSSAKLRLSSAEVGAWLATVRRKMSLTAALPSDAVTFR